MADPAVSPQPIPLKRYDARLQREIPGEEWRPVPGYPFLEASSEGRVRLADGKTIIPDGPAERGYRRVQMPMSDGKTLRLRAHRVIAMAFHGPPPTPKHEVAHWDGVRWNNVPSNLRWATRLENIEDAFRHGTRKRAAPKIPKPRGRRPLPPELRKPKPPLKGGPKKKLTDRDVLKIRLGHGYGMTQTELAHQFGVSIALINHIVRGRERKNVMVPQGLLIE
jgi:hypothetical protein